MTFVRIKQTAIILMLGIVTIFSANDSFASVTWLSSITGAKAPACIAVDVKGNTYVTDLDGNRLLVFDRRGAKARTLVGLKDPTGVAVDNSFRIFVSNRGTGSVNVYNPDFSLAYKLGKGDGEFKAPVGLAISANGRVYVADRDAHTIKIYNLDGTAVSSFGGRGGGNGQFNAPLGLAIDDARGELYVTDSGIIPDSTNSNAPMSGARVQAFDLNGGFLRSFGSYGREQGQMMRPVGIATDGAGLLYITDAFWYPVAAIHVFTTAGSWVETVADGAHELKGPFGIAVGKDLRMFASAVNGPQVQVYGLPGYTTMDVTSATPLSFATQAGANPAAQDITISNSGSGTLNWTATATTSDGSSWLVPQASGSAAPGGASTVSVSIDIVKTSLPAGTYTGTVTITAASGAEEKVAVTLTVTPAPVPQASLSVTPSSLSFKAQLHGPAPASQAISINNSGGGSMTWTATSAQTWLVLNATSTSLTVSPAMSELTADATGSITITAPGAQNSPITVPVTVQIANAGTVKVSSNISAASFKISGKASLSGSGSSWSNEEVAPGDYSINFKYVPGYNKPQTRTFTVKAGQETVINGDYRKKSVPTHIIAGSGNSGTVAVMTIDGKPAFTITPFTDHANVRVAAGDLDGSGVDKIVVSNYRHTIKVYSAQGAPLASYELPEGSERADVAVADIDNDGKAEIVVGAEAESNDKEQRKITALSYVEGAIQEKTVLLTESNDGKFSFALGDVNDDGALELLIADSSNVRAFALPQTTGASLAQLWAKSGKYDQIAAGDLNNDGIAEIAVSYEGRNDAGRHTETKGRERDRDGNSHHVSLISILKSTGEDTGIVIEPFKDLGCETPSTVVMGDINGDGNDELVVGAGENSDPLVRVFASDGTYAGVTMKPMNGKSGVNVGLGKLQ